MRKVGRPPGGSGIIGVGLCWAGARYDQDNGCTRTAMLDIPCCEYRMEIETALRCRLGGSISLKQLPSWKVSLGTARARGT